MVKRVWYDVHSVTYETKGVERTGYHYRVFINGNQVRFSNEFTTVRAAHEYGRRAERYAARLAGVRCRSDKPTIGVRHMIENVHNNDRGYRYYQSHLYMPGLYGLRMPPVGTRDEAYTAAYDAVVRKENER